MTKANASMRRAAAASLQRAAACRSESAVPSVRVIATAAILPSRVRPEKRITGTVVRQSPARVTESCRWYYSPASREEAIALATELVFVQRHSVDLGLMQVNSANLAGLGLSITDAFDTCRNIRAGSRILAAGYVAPGNGGDTQPALIQALSRYNTGNPERGVTNGYVGRVQAAAEQVVPAIRLRGEAAAPSGSSVAPVTSETLPLPPPAWDVFAQALAARGRQLKPPLSPSVTPPSPQRTADVR